jgi:hypothetical protein
MALLGLPRVLLAVLHPSSKTVRTIAHQTDSSFRLLSPLASDPAVIEIRALYYDDLQEARCLFVDAAKR